MKQTNEDKILIRHGQRKKIVSFTHRELGNLFGITSEGPGRRDADKIFYKVEEIICAFENTELSKLLGINIVRTWDDKTKCFLLIFDTCGIISVTNSSLPYGRDVMPPPGRVRNGRGKHAHTSARKKRP